MTTVAHTPRNLLILCGSSGSGKSTLEKNLIEEYPELFHKLQQVSTRKMRAGERFGDPYIFVQPSTFEHLQDRLIGRLGVVENSLFKDKYGSIPDFVDGKVSTVILAEEAIIDFQNMLKTFDIKFDNVFILGLDVKFENLDQKDLREGRNEDFIARERNVLEHATLVYRTENGKYLHPKVVVNLLENIGFFK